MEYSRPKLLHYRIAQGACGLVAGFIFRKKIRRNEIKGKKGPFVVIANHEAALDFVSLIGATRRPMTIVISSSFYNTLPIRGFLDKMGVIPKQQFQTTVKDLKRMKAVIDAGEPIVIYPAGLMCEDGLSTPIPTATYKFLKWLNADIYAARISGSYFVMPKWAAGMRPGRTYLDIYKLFSREELAAATVEAVKEKADEALLFDAYREQETLRVKYKGNENIAGLENVLYLCPHCKKEFTMQVKENSTLYCTSCGYEEVSDEYGFLHKRSEIGEELRYVSDWSRIIYTDLKEKISRGEESSISAKTKIRMIDQKKHKFVDVGQGMLSLSKTHFVLEGEINGKMATISTSISNVPALPFSPGKHLELQHGEQIYRCVPEDGRLVMKFINMLKIFNEINHKKQ